MKLWPETKNVFQSTDDVCLSTLQNFQKYFDYSIYTHFSRVLKIPACLYNSKIQCTRDRVRFFISLLNSILVNQAILQNYQKFLTMNTENLRCKIYNHWIPRSSLPLWDGDSNLNLCLAYNIFPRKILRLFVISVCLVKKQIAILITVNSVPEARYNCDFYGSFVSMIIHCKHAIFRVGQNIRQLGSHW